MDHCAAVALEHQPLLHGSLPQLVAAEHVALLVDEGGAEELEGVDPLLSGHQVPVADEELDDVDVAGDGSGQQRCHAYRDNTAFETNTGTTTQNMVQRPFVIKCRSIAKLLRVLNKCVECPLCRIFHRSEI